MKNQKGITLIETLVILAIIGVLGVLAAVAVNSARVKQRDAVRLSHVRQMQSALEDFYVQNNVYPEGGGIPLGSTVIGCLDTESFKPLCDAGATNVLVRRIPATIATGLDELVTCGGSTSAYCYAHLQGAKSYAIQFELERPVPLANLAEGLNCATPEGMSAGTCLVE